MLRKIVRKIKEIIFGRRISLKEAERMANLVREGYSPQAVFEAFNGNPKPLMEEAWDLRKDLRK